MLWHDSVFLTLWHKWGLSKNKSWLPCYLQSKSELRPELAETVRVASLAFLLDALPTIRMSTLLDALGVCTESPTRLLYDVSWTIAGDGCSWRWPAVPQKDEERSYAMLRTCCRIHFKRWQNAPQLKQEPRGPRLGWQNVASQNAIEIRYWHVLTRFDRR